MSQKLQEAITAIYNLDNDELDQAILAVKQRRQFLTRSAIRVLRVNDTVEFEARGRTVRGTVIKVNQKNVKVREQGYGTWNVPASMLRHVVDA